MILLETFLLEIFPQIKIFLELKQNKMMNKISTNKYLNIDMKMK